jgi:hypothetical protein
LADASVGAYLNRHYIAAFQKVATFQINGRQKQGGNVASYFCTADGLVLHAVAGPVDARTFLRECRWANETYQLGLLDNHKTVPELQIFFRKAHLDRLHKEQRVHVAPERLRLEEAARTPQALGQLLDQNAHLRLSNQGKVHLLMAVAPLPRLDLVYQVVFEKILNEKISTDPVAVAP